MVKGIAGRLCLQKSDVEKIMNAFIDEVKDSFRKGQRVEIHQFGTFFPHKRKAHQVRIPSTGQMHEVKSKIVLKFKSSKHMEIMDSEGVL
jgi:nucleoid DNA-binding protein